MTKLKAFSIILVFISGIVIVGSAVGAANFSDHSKDKEWILNNQDKIKTDPKLSKKAKVRIIGPEGNVLIETTQGELNERKAEIERRIGIYLGSNENRKAYQEGKFADKPDGSWGKPDKSFLDSDSID
ncbi:hypothetical protein [Gracilibacillus sp. YIM 98692]|uniref:hypothetical protein n=1 Tax=Gracilibacillus sp. YIM 98692 TaxID=2663532 RepID=UPI0013D0F97C|nr:hypothetical protein [Gracilibacillus sp. YIM 98692]